MPKSQGIPLATAYPDASGSPGLELWRVTNAWQRSIRETLAPFDLTHVQFVLLASATWMNHTAHVTQRELAHHAGIDPMMTSQVLRTLEAKQLIQRTPHPDDGRAWVISATPAGAALASKANLAVEAADLAFFAPLDSALPEFVKRLSMLDRTHRG